MRSLLVDIGGTNMRVTAASNVRSLTKDISIPTPKSYARGIQEIVRIKNTLVGKQRIDAVVIGIAGTLSRDHTTLIHSPNLRAWVHAPIVQSLSKRLNVPVVMENDAALVGLGEAVYGAGKRHRIVAYLTVSTGVGGARIVEKRIDKASFGFEPGHQSIDFNGPAVPGLHYRGTIESFISGTAFKRKYRRHPRTITTTRVWQRYAGILAYGLVNVTVMWSPDVIVLGGSMFRHPGISVNAVRRMLTAHLRGFIPPPRVVRGTLHDIGGLYGAFVISRRVRLHKNNP